jgi:probable HAF family extracellular repeat protein
MHQFVINQTGVEFGNVALQPSVDWNIDNGPVINANNGAKEYSYTYKTVAYPRASQTQVTGINDISGTSMISTPGVAGQIVGWYTSARKTHGFLLRGSSYSSFDYPNAQATYPYAINNSGQIVGYYEDASGNYYAFLLGGSGCSNGCSFVYPGARANTTTALGINDAGQIVGNYLDNIGVSHGFLYYGSNFSQSSNYYSFDCPGGTQTYPYGINGDGTIAGQSQNPAASYEVGFVNYVLPPTWTGTFSTFSYPGSLGTFPRAIDNDNDVTGSYAPGNGGSDLGFQYSEGVLWTQFQYPGSSFTYLYSANDFGQVLGAANSGFVGVP